MTEYSDLLDKLRKSDALCQEAADTIELLQRELKCANELWEQQKELALEYLADIAELHKQDAYDDLG